jgi:hypothetical protein
MRGPETQPEYKFAARCVSNFKYFYLAPSQRLRRKKSTLVREEIAFLKPLIEVTLNLRLKSPDPRWRRRISFPDFSHQQSALKYPVSFEQRSTFKGIGWNGSVAVKVLSL